MGSVHELPDSTSIDLHLSHPTPDECVKIWTNTFDSWKDSLTLPAFLTESKFLTTIPLAMDGGMTTWILVDKNLPPDKRPILCSCETFRKRALMSDACGNVQQVLVHGIASVFCPSEYRRRGCAARLMREVAEVLRNWQSEHGKCVGSVLYSDIGKKYYAKLGWIPDVNNSHLVFPSGEIDWPAEVRQVAEEHLKELCSKDELMIQAAMATPDPTVERRLIILPDLDHMLWHIGKEDFATQCIFGKVPQAKGAIAGSPGKQVWAIWTHRYYSHPDEKTYDNVLYILRLVIEGDETANKVLCDNKLWGDLGNAEQAASLKAVLQASQAEAAAWQLDRVKLWKPSVLVQSLVSQSGLGYVEVEREQESVASGMWYGDDGGMAEAPAWINNEHYAWC
ncbi:hypothetical protein AK830_g199 [Neonectria ditissima]|uniref:LYC1 C-terminal domain-containing protein n=1 Tax=Neonectria ditissima TaxID=78410 RepID=A0A0P7BWU1_9HYPO|nr:hypothetical protein AK830_g199 [Neonectria ditissima]